MPKGITYSADTPGGTVTRYSAGHLTPRYTHVVIGTGTPSFRKDAASAEYERSSRQTIYDRCKGKSRYGDTMLPPVVYPVTARPGR